MTTFPLELIQEIQEYSETSDLYRFLLSCKVYFYHILRQVKKFTLKDPPQSSAYYYPSEEAANDSVLQLLREDHLREVYLSQIPSPAYQLSIKTSLEHPFQLEHLFHKFPHLSFLELQACHKLDESFFQNNKGSFMNYSKIILRENDFLEEIPAFFLSPQLITPAGDADSNNRNSNKSQIKSLELWFFKIKALPSCVPPSSSSTSTTPLTMKLKELTLARCNSLIGFPTTTASLLTGLHSLTLFRCHNLSDLSALGNIPQLILNSCHSVRNISPLVNNSSLTIYNCDWIETYPSIKKMQTKHLRIDFLDTFIDHLQYFPHLISFRASTYPNKALPLPITCRSISFNFCSHFKTLAGLSQLHFLFLKNCPILNDISGLKLTQAKYVTIENCPLVTDFSALQHIPRVMISKCPQFFFAEDVSDVKFLTIYQCHYLENLEPLSNVTSLVIEDCHDISSLEGLSNVDIIDISGDCSKLTSLEGLGNNKKIILSAQFSDLMNSDTNLKGLFQLVETRKVTKGLQFIYLRKQDK